MSERSIPKRYTIIMDMFKEDSYPKQHEIIKKFENQGLKCSRRTFQRTLESMRDEFGIEIIYSITERGYYIDKEKCSNHTSLIDLLNYYKAAENLSFTLSLANNIQIDSSSLMQGLDHLPLIIKALKTNTQVIVEYQKFNQGKKHKFQFNPNY